MFTLFVCSAFLSNVIFVSGADGDSGKMYSAESATTTASLITQMSIDITRIDKEKSEFTIQLNNVQEAIKNVKSKCGKEVEGIIERKKTDLIKRTDINRQVLEELFVLIVQEERKHESLVLEFKSYSDLYDLWVLKHDVLQGDVELLGRRRSQGTADRCKCVTAKVAAEEGLNAKARASYWKEVLISRRETTSQVSVAENIQFKSQQATLSRRDAEKCVVLTMLEQARSTLRSEEEICARSRLEAEHLLESATAMHGTSEDSKAVLQKDLSLAQRFNQELTVRIESKRNSIREWTMRVMELKRTMSRYRNDINCYITVDRYC